MLSPTRYIFIAILYCNFTFEWKLQSYELLKNSLVPNWPLYIARMFPLIETAKESELGSALQSQEVPLAIEQVYILLPRSSKISPISMKHGSARESFFPSTSSP